MTDREKAIVMAYTGICMLTGDKFQIYHKYIEEIMGRPVFTHELGNKDIQDKIEEKAKADFIALCAEQDSCENCVSRAKLKNWLDINFSFDGRFFADNKCKECAAVYSRLLKQAKWIPVSERLPEEGKVVLTQVNYKGDVKMAISSRVDYNYWTGLGTREVNVVAWMPLPKPYKAESER